MNWRFGFEASQKQTEKQLGFSVTLGNCVDLKNAASSVISVEPVSGVELHGMQVNNNKNNNNNYNNYNNNNNNNYNNNNIFYLDTISFAA